MTRSLFAAVPFALGLALALLPPTAFAQAGSVPADSFNRPGGTRIAPQAVARPPRLYAETTVSVAANAWTLVAPGSVTAQKLILGDAAGLGCAFSLNGAPAAGEGVPFSLAGAPGSYVFDDPAPVNPVYARCASAGVITVVSA